MRSGKFFMEMIYRGYPLPWQAAVWDTAEVMAESMDREPYMLYKREDQVNEENNRRGLREEQEYFKGLYPMTVRRNQVFVEEICDRYDYPDSMIYDDYPDRESMLILRDKILTNASDNEGMVDENMTYVLLLHEVERRRNLKRE